MGKGKSFVGGIILIAGLLGGFEGRAQSSMQAGIGDSASESHEIDQGRGWQIFKDFKKSLNQIANPAKDQVALSSAKQQALAGALSLSLESVFDSQNEVSGAFGLPWDLGASFYWSTAPLGSSDPNLFQVATASKKDGDFFLPGGSTSILSLDLNPVIFTESDLAAFDATTLGYYQMLESMQVQIFIYSSSFASVTGENVQHVGFAYQWPFLGQEYLGFFRLP